jgi:hypothetical protein
VTTNQKNLEHEEARVFLKYCQVRLLDVIDMAMRRLGLGTPMGSALSGGTGGPTRSIWTPPVKRKE